MEKVAEFRQLVTEAVSQNRVVELADHFEAAQSTIRRWANGTATPHPGIMEEALKMLRTPPTIREKAITHLQMMRRTPRMYFTCREALLASVTHLVALLDDDFDTREFYATHAGTHGNCYNDMSVPVEDDWAHKTIDAAIARLSIDKPET